MASTRIGDERHVAETYHLDEGWSLNINVHNLRVKFTPGAKWSGPVIDALKLIQDPDYKDCWSGDDVFAVKMLVAGGALEDGTII